MRIPYEPMAHWGVARAAYFRAQELLRQGHSYLDGSGDGDAWETEL
jgi:hypothetical protein